MLTDPVSFYVASLLLGAAGGGGVAWFVERRHAGKAPVHPSVAPMTGTEAHGVMAAIDGMASALVHHTAATKANTATVAEAVAAQKARIAVDADKIEPRLAPPPAEPAAPPMAGVPTGPSVPVVLPADAGPASVYGVPMVPSPSEPAKLSEADRMEAAAARQEVAAAQQQTTLVAMQALYERMTELAMPQPVPATTPALTMTVANPSPATAAALAIAAGPAAA
jgi:hypothetical protein